MNSWQRWFAIPLSTRWAICIWFTLLVGVLGRVAVDRITAQSVVPIYILGGERWWNAEPLYGPPPGTMDVYRNPPGFAALFAPLSQLPPRPVGLAWRIAGIGLFILGLRRFLAAIHPVPLPPPAEATVWIVAAFVVLPAFNNGQVNLPLLAGATLATAAAARGRWWQAAFWAMFAVWLKVYPIALAGLLVLLAPNRLGWRMPLALVAFLLWPHALRDSTYIGEQWSGFRIALAGDDRGDATLHRTMKGWTYLFRVTAGESVDRLAMQAVAAGAGLLLAAVILRAKLRAGPTPPLFGYTLCLGLLWMVLFGPATESNTYSILAPVGWLIVAPGLSRPARILAGLGCGLLIVAVLRGTFPNDPDWTLASVQPIGALLLLVAGVRGTLAR